MGNFASKVFSSTAVAEQGIEHVSSSDKRTVLSELSKDEGVRVLIAEGADFIRTALWELEKELDPGDTVVSEVSEHHRHPRRDRNQNGGREGEVRGTRRKKKRREGAKHARPTDIPWHGPGYPGDLDRSTGPTGRRHPPDRPSGPFFPPMKPEKHMRFRDPLNSYIPGAPASHSYRGDLGPDERSWNPPPTVRPRSRKFYAGESMFFPGEMVAPSEDDETEPSRKTTSEMDAASSVTTPDDSFRAEMGYGGNRQHRHRDRKSSQQQQKYRDRSMKSARRGTRGRPPKGEFVYEPPQSDTVDDRDKGGGWLSASIPSSSVASPPAQEWPLPYGHAHGASSSMGLRGGKGGGRRGRGRGGRKGDIPSMSGAVPGRTPRSRYPAATRMSMRGVGPDEGFPMEGEGEGYRFGYGDGGHPLDEGIMSPGGELGGRDLGRRGGGRRGRGGRGHPRQDRRSRENARSSSA